LSVLLAGGPYRWISKALSTLRSQPLTPPTHRHCRRVENGEAFSTRQFQATSLVCRLALYAASSGLSNKVMFPLIITGSTLSFVDC
jgi:hypothetical protein